MARAPSPAVVFVWDEPVEINKHKYGIFPFKEKFEFSLDIWETQKIDPNRTAKYRFHGWYRWNKAFEDYHSRRSIVLSYNIYANSSEDDSDKIVFDTGNRKIEIPFKDVINYVPKEPQAKNP